MKLLVLAAPSGSGKTTLVHRLLKEFPKLAFSVSATTRKPRLNEQDGIDYHFLSLTEFKRKINSDFFLEWEEVYENNFYGSLKSDVKKLWDKGQTVVFDIDVYGGIRLKEKYDLNTLSIFIMPPSIEVLEDRLRKRGADNEERIHDRLAKAKEEISFAANFDHVVVNDQIETAFKQIQLLVAKFIRR
jgi:guanylate kinase